MPKYIFIVGGVMSGVGKGIVSASLGKLLQSRGYKVTATKIDPYVNVDAGTMNPIEHGEVFVLNDGKECDQDMGNYERFLNTSLSGDSYMTTGSVYQTVINKERNLEYKGKCVEVVPHIPLEVIEKINNATKKEKAEIVITEIGGTVGEYQNILFLEAVRILKHQHPGDVLLILVSYLPFQSHEGELKTKPTQYAVRTINSAGLQPDIIVARAKVALDEKRKEKIAFNCNINGSDVISAPDVESIYTVPIGFEKEGLTDNVLKKLNLKSKTKDLTDWKNLVSNINSAKKVAKIGVVGKYFTTGKFVLADSYISVIEAIKHACYEQKLKPEITWINAEDFEKNKSNLKQLNDFNGVIVPGGFGKRGTEGKILAIQYLRENKIPFLGLCYGMQMATIEFARHVANMYDANTSEIDPKSKHMVIDIMEEQKKKLKNKDYGGTMRLGAYPAVLKKDTIANKAYGEEKISERHRHRYEVNPQYIKKLEDKGLIFSGMSPNGQLTEIIELSEKEHPFFLATQFHPEFLSKPLNPHPLFREFIKKSVK